MSIENPRPHTFPGDRSGSLFARWMYRTCRKKLLDTLKIKYGELYWFHPNLGSSKVLVVYKPECAAEILKDQSWLFHKALEPWHDRKNSRDPYERLIGDGLFLSDGNHHRKHSSFLMQRLGNSKVIDTIDCLLLDMFNEVDEQELISFVNITNRIMNIILASAYGIKLSCPEQEHLAHCIEKANAVVHKRELCPYRLVRRKATHSTLTRIDDVRNMLSRYLSCSVLSQVLSEGKSVVGLSQTSILEEVLAVCIGIMSKIPSLLQIARLEQMRMDADVMQSVRMERSVKYYLPDFISSTGDSCWPATDTLLAGAIQNSDSAYRLLKRVNVCDVEIMSVSVPEATEFWIPSWLNKNQFFYGAGSYSCKGQFLSQLIAGRYLQTLCGKGQSDGLDY